MDNETLKRTRTSPRINVINEVQSIINTHIEGARLTPDGDAVIEALTALYARVDELRAGHPKEDKDDTTVAVVGKKGTHYVGVTGEEKVLYLRRDKEGVYHSDSDEVSRETLAHIYGPFTTEAGARYAATHDTYTSRPQVQ